MTEYAVPCAKCGKYYPGDCLNDDDGCQDKTCGCDGCVALEDD